MRHAIDLIAVILTPHSRAVCGKPATESVAFIVFIRQKKTTKNKKSKKIHCLLPHLPHPPYREHTNKHTLKCCPKNDRSKKYKTKSKE